IMGTYVHGLFDSNSFRRAFLRRLRERLGLSDPGGEDAHFDLEEELDELALRVREALDMDRVCALLKLPPLKG
ncbi:MAG: cobyric acid synthase CobQ, partial [Nitrospinota bacterium]